MPGQHWLFKTEPSDFSFDDLLREKTAVWDGVANAQALQNLRTAKKGDAVLVYHTGDEKAAVGLATLASDPYADPNAEDPKLVVVRVKAGKRLERKVTLKEVKANAKFANFALVKNSRLSVIPVNDDEWDELLRLADAAI
jgi:predicted RNA-binding protein with PUA-like domain